jgi:hypothetical protein
LNLVSKVSNLCFWKKKLNLFEFKNAFDLDFKSKDFLFFSSSPNSFGPITLRSPFFFLTTAGLASLSSPANIPSREAIRPSSAQFPFIYLQPAPPPPIEVARRRRASRRRAAGSSRVASQDTSPALPETTVLSPPLPNVVSTPKLKE